MRLGVAETEDAGVALGARALVAGRRRPPRGPARSSPAGSGPRRRRGRAAPRRPRRNGGGRARPRSYERAAAGTSYREGPGSTLGGGDEWDGRVDAPRGRRHPGEPGQSDAHGAVAAAAHVGLASRRGPGAGVEPVCGPSASISWPWPVSRFPPSSCGGTSGPATLPPR